jgi:bis(5'-nucleosyl)-tetraphosphatase (symmetrical)
VAVYAIGDIQGCAEPLHELLGLIDFQPERDRLWLAGDLVNRGPHSLDVLRFVKSLGDRATVVLGNHDLHLLAVWSGGGRLKPKDSLMPVLTAPDADELLHWLRRQPLLHYDPALGYLMVHAGIAPAWDLATARRCAGELERVLAGNDFRDFLCHIYGDQPDQWSEQLSGIDRLRYITNVFTRMRCCAADGRLLLDFKGEPKDRPSGYYPWFQAPNRRYEGPTIICGHWSALGYHDGDGVLALDTGCLWGGALTAIRLDAPGEPVSLPCRSATGTDE